MIDKLNEIYNKLETIKYGFIFEGKDISDDELSFSKNYRLQSPEELVKSKYGVCWDQVEYERYLFDHYNINCKSYFIYLNDHEGLPSHTFMVVQDDSKYYWFEHSWYDYRGIHEYNDINELFEDIINKFIKSHDDIKYDELLLYEYNKPNNNISCDEFYNYIDKQKLIIERNN